MKFDTAFIKIKGIREAIYDDMGTFVFEILPIVYTDGKRNPRLPRKSSKQTNLQVDTNHVLSHVFGSINTKSNSIDRFKVDIKLYKANDGLGGGDVDNYCKAILDGITSIRKIWTDDKQVDELCIKRIMVNGPYSFLEVRILKIQVIPLAG